VKPATAAALVRSGQLGVLLALPRTLRGYYRVCFLGGAASCGLLGRLAAGPVPLERLVPDLAPGPGGRDGLAAWLDFGVRLGELAVGPQGYRLRSRLARRLSEPANDAVAALIEEAARLHHSWVADAPAHLRAGRRFTMADQDGALVARSSRILAPFIGEAVDACVPRRGPLRLLEVGCGSGVHLKRAAERNPELTALGLDLQADAAAQARENMRAWGLDGRVRIEVGDVRARRPEPAFDLVTLHNVLNYFPVSERVSVLAHLRGFLAPGGRLLVSLACRGRSVTTELLNLWGALTEGCGPLPTPAELEAQLGAAGYGRVRRWGLVPGEPFLAFVAPCDAGSLR